MTDVEANATNFVQICRGGMSYWENVWMAESNNNEKEIKRQNRMKVSEATNSEGRDDVTEEKQGSHSFLMFA